MAHGAINGGSENNEDDAEVAEGLGRLAEDQGARGAAPLRAADWPEARQRHG